MIECIVISMGNWDGNGTDGSAELLFSLLAIEEKLSLKALKPLPSS